MCGIAGIIRFDGSPVDPDRLAHACVVQRHRGPDQSGIWVDARNGGAVGLSAVRLAVLDPSHACAQPFRDPTGRYVLAYNGEVYNFREVRQVLAGAGYAFRTHGDTEVVLAACMHWGAQALPRLNGMWALAFYDAQERKGFLARDRFGKKPLLWSADARRLLFASEMSGLHALDELGGSICQTALVQLLRYGYIAAPGSLLQGVQRLEPGHYMPFDGAHAGAPVRWYNLVPRGPAGEPGGRSFGETCRTVRRALQEAVVARGVSDVPIGAFLSGGLDSSIVTHHLQEARGDTIHTFSLGYAGQRAYDESGYARLVARHVGTRHHALVLSTDDIIEALPAVLDHLSEPVGDSSILPAALVSRHARQTVTVALSGDGGDELFGGYWRYLGHRCWEAYHRLPGIVRKRLVEPALARCAAARSSPMANRVRQFRKLIRAGSDDPLTRHLAWSRILAPEAEPVFHDEGLGLDLDRAMHAAAVQLTRALEGRAPLARILAFDVQYALPADMLHKVDTAGMMHSLEVRTPFLDPALVELALGLPMDLRIDRGQRKKILVDAYRGILPDEVLDRPKQGFEVPLGELFRGPLRTLLRDVVSPKAVESLGLLSFPAIQEVFEQHDSRRGDHADLLFALLSLCWWRSRVSGRGLSER